MHKLIGYLCDELEEMEDKVREGGKLSTAELQYGDMLAHFKKNLLKAEAMHEDADYSNTQDHASYAKDGSGHYVRPDGSYRDGGESHARGRTGSVKRDSMGRYSRSDRDITDDLYALMEKAPSEHVREEIRKLADRL